MSAKFGNLVGPFYSVDAIYAPELVPAFAIGVPRNIDYTLAAMNYQTSLVAIYRLS